MVSSNTTTYAWDYENRLTSVTLPSSSGTVTFKYDPLGRRIYKSLSTGGTSVFVYDGVNLIEETNSSGTVVARYEQTQTMDEPLAMLRTSATNYYEADGLGSVTSLSNAAGAVAQTYAFDSFGKTTPTGSLVNPFQYTGRELDAETGLYYYHARYYDPNSGRFLSEDPIGFAGSGTDFYAYVRNDSINLDDPLGLCPCQNEGRALTPSDYSSIGRAAKWNPITAIRDLSEFAKGAPLDGQVLASGTPAEKAAYGNYVYGVWMAASGTPLGVALEQTGTRRGVNCPILHNIPARKWIEFGNRSR